MLMCKHEVISSSTTITSLNPVAQELVLVLRRMAAENKIELDLPNIHLKH